jgi:hypothetical protein
MIERVEEALGMIELINLYEADDEPERMARVVAELTALRDAAGGDPARIEEIRATLMARAPELLATFDGLVVAV